MTCACEMGAGMWSMMLLPGLLFAALVIGAVVLVRGIRDRSTGGAAREKAPAVSLLEERYARGEIDGDEFRERRERLVGHEV